jgi:endonuclease/exonuclease/phosphatase family metal-dependent hydrolase
VQARTFRFATWNIGGGILGESHQRDALPSIDYYASVLREHGPDVVCLQEAHSFTGSEGQTEYLARHCGYPYVESSPISGSHLVQGAFLTLGILSRFPIAALEYRQFPNPGLTATGPDGSHWELLDKGYVKAVVHVGDGHVGVLNGHCFPLHYFSAAATEPRFRELWHMLADDLLDMGEEMPTIAGLDLNHAPAADLLTGLLRSGDYASAFDRTSTTRKGIQQDYILYDRGIDLLETTIRPTKSDHSYCQVRVIVRPAEPTSLPGLAGRAASLGYQPAPGR